MQPVYNISDVILDSQKDGGGSTLKQRPVSAPDAISGEPFKCGTPSKDFDKMVTRRRKDYGEAIRKHVSRPKTASSFFGTFSIPWSTQLLRLQCSFLYTVPRRILKCSGVSKFRTFVQYYTYHFYLHESTCNTVIRMVGPRKKLILIRSVVCSISNNQRLKVTKLAQRLALESL